MKRPKLKYILIVLVFILFFYSMTDILTRMTRKPMEMEPEISIWQDLEIKSYQIYEDSIVTWDDTKLKFYDLDGGTLTEILGNGYYTNVYYYEDSVVVLDKQINGLYVYNTIGEREQKIDLKVPVTGVMGDGEDYYLHVKENGTDNELVEKILFLDGDEYTPVYETDKFIIDYIIDGKYTYVSEIMAENFTYRSILKIIGPRSEEVYNFDNETVLDAKKIGRRYMALTDKNLYSLKNGEKEKVEIEHLNDYFFKDSQVVILDGSTLKIYKANLGLQEEYNMEINASGVVEHLGSYFVYGPTDIVGFVGEDREFTKKFQSIIYGVDENKDHILVMYRYSGEIYTMKKIEEEK